MQSIQLTDKELKQITLFLVDRKVVFHPVISPEGYPDFTNFEDRKFVLILDRNLVVKILRLVNEGELNDKFTQTLVGSLLFWVEFNNISITSGMALNEYSYFHKGNVESSLENNIFVNIFEHYSPKDWLDLALDKRRKIQKIVISQEETYDFFLTEDHFKMHYLEMLKLAQLYFDNQLSITQKFQHFHQWIFDNILICKYTTYFSALAFGKKSKMFKKGFQNYEKIIGECTNQAWDLTYLSLWSTLYHESYSKIIYLFATDDSELKELFINTHKEPWTVYNKIYGSEIGGQILQIIEGIYVTRTNPEIDSARLDEMIIKEKEKLRMIYDQHGC